MNKRGLSEIVGIVLIVLLVIAAVISVWFGVKTLIENSQFDFTNVGLVIVEDNIIVDPTQAKLSIALKNTGSTSFEGVKFILEDSEGDQYSEHQYFKEQFKQHETRILNLTHDDLYDSFVDANFILDYPDFNYQNIVKITVAPILVRNNKEKISPFVDDTEQEPEEGDLPDSTISTGGSSGSGGGDSYGNGGGAVCGDGNCDAGEDCSNCEIDCGTCPTGDEITLLNFNAPTETIGLYDKFEIDFKIDLDEDGIDNDDAVYGIDINPFNPNLVADTWSLAGMNVTIELTSPTSQQSWWPAFYYRDYIRSRNEANGREILTEVADSDTWKIRFTPNEVGTWTYKIKVQTEAGSGYTDGETIERQFIVEDTENPGFISLSNDDSRYYELDGSVFFGVGENVGHWQGELYGKTYFYNEMFGNLSELNITLARVRINNGVEDDTYAGNIEDGCRVAETTMNTEGLNDYDLDDAWRYDKIFNIAEQNNIYIRLVLFDIVNFVDENWDRLDADRKGWPYSVEHGGMCNSRNEFFTNTQAIEYQKRLLRYIIARYGYAPQLHSWELWNEQYNVVWHGISSGDVLNWDIEMYDYIKSIDKNHLVSTSSVTGLLSSGEGFWVHLDDADFHSGFYRRTGEEWRRDTGGRDQTWQSPYNMNYMQQIAEEQGVEHPNFFGEWALQRYDAEIPHLEYMNLLYEIADTNGIAYHNAIWASSMEAGFGGMQRWYWIWNDTIWFYNLNGIPGFLEYWEGEKPYNMVSVRNLVYNPSFETENTIWNGMEGWNVPSQHGGGTWSVVNTESHSGSNSVQIARDGTAGYSYLFLVNTLQVKPNTEYIFSGWAKKDPGVGTLANFKWGNGQTSNLGTSTNDWEYFEEIFTTPADLYDPFAEFGHRIELVGTGTTIGNAWFDDISLIEGTDKVNSTSLMLRVHGLKNNTQAYLWLQNREYIWWNVVVDENTPTTILAGETVTIPGMQQGNYNIEWWETYTGAISNTETISVGTDEILTLTLPEIQEDVAVKIKPQ